MMVLMVLMVQIVIVRLNMCTDKLVLSCANLSLAVFNYIANFAYATNFIIQVVTTFAGGWGKSK